MILKSLELDFFRNYVHLEAVFDPRVNLIYGDNAQGKTNLLEAIDDVLVKYQVLKDDDSKIIVSHDGSRVLFDPDRPRTEVTIRFMESNAPSCLGGGDKPCG